MITVVTWLWSQKGRQVLYKPEYVNTWARMISRNLTIPHRLLCITDNPEGIEIETYPLWEPPEVINEKWGITRPQCYVRLKAFSEEMKPILGDRFVSVDLDCVVTGSLDAVFSKPDDFIINKGETLKNDYNGSMWMMNTGARSKVWSGFSQDGVRKASESFMGSDQGWIRYCLGSEEKTFTNQDGVFSYVRIKNDRRWRPNQSCIVFFQGSIKPWDSTAQKHIWVRDNWK
jgi:hypothetical protein